MSQLGGLHGKGKGIRGLCAQRGRGGEQATQRWKVSQRVVPGGESNSRFSYSELAEVGSIQGRAALHCWP